MKKKEFNNLLINGDFTLSTEELSIANKKSSQADLIVKCQLIEENDLIVTLYATKHLYKMQFQPIAVVNLMENGYQSFYHNDGDYTYSTGLLERKLYRYGIAYGKAYMDVAMLDVAAKFMNEELKNATGFIECIYNYQNKINAERKAKRNFAKEKQLQDVMDTVPNVPKNFEKWVWAKVLKEQQVIVYKKEKKVIKGYCTHCHRDVTIKETAKHNDYIVCPSCKNVAQLKAIGRFKGGIMLEKWCFLTQKVTTSDGIVVRAFYVRAYLNAQNYHQQPKLFINETIRYFYDNNGNGSEYCLSYYTGKWKMGDIKVPYFMASYKNIVHEGFCYPYNLKSALKDTPFEYSRFIEYNKCHQDISYWYFLAYMKCPILGKLYTEGYKSFANALRDREISLSLFNDKETTLYRFLNLPNHYAQRVIKNGLEYKQVEFYHWLKQNRIDNINEQEAEAVYRKYSTYNGKLNLEVIFQQTNKVTKVLNYLNKQKATLNNMDELAYLKDYLSMARSIERMLKEEGQEVEPYPVFPMNLVKMHDEVVEIYNELVQIRNEKLEKEKEEAYKNRYEEAVEYCEDEYSIIAPKSLAELINEGNTLHHCVAGYRDRMLKGQTCILFLRKTSKAKIPFFTMEYNESIQQIVQLRGYENCTYSEEIKAFRDRWLEIQQNKQHTKNKKRRSSKIA